MSCIKSQPCHTAQQLMAYLNVTEELDTWQPMMHETSLLPYECRLSNRNPTSSTERTTTPPASTYSTSP